MLGIIQAEFGGLSIGHLGRKIAYSGWPYLQRSFAVAVTLVVAAYHGVAAQVKCESKI